MSDVYKAPDAALNEPRGTGEYGSVESALAGNYELQPIELIKEAWANLKGYMGTFWIATVIYIVIVGVLNAGLAMFVDPDSFGAMNLVGQVISSLVLTPLAAGLMMIGIKHSVGSPIEFKELFKHYDKTINLFVTTLLMYILVAIGFVLLILPGVYLMVGFSMAMPLVVEKNMKPVDALKTSLKAINHKWFNMLGLFFVMMLVVVAGAIALLVGMIWAMPVVSLAYAILYRNMFGVEDSTRE